MCWWETRIASDLRDAKWMNWSCKKLGQTSWRWKHLKSGQYASRYDWPTTNLFKTLSRVQLDEEHQLFPTSFCDFLFAHSKRVAQLQSPRYHGLEPTRGRMTAILTAVYTPEMLTCTTSIGIPSMCWSLLGYDTYIDWGKICMLMERWHATVHHDRRKMDSASSTTITALARRQLTFVLRIHSRFLQYNWSGKELYRSTGQGVLQRLTLEDNQEKNHMWNLHDDPLGTVRIRPVNISKNFCFVFSELYLGCYIWLRISRTADFICVAYNPRIWDHVDAQVLIKMLLPITGKCSCELTAPGHVHLLEAESAARKSAEGESKSLV